MNQNKLPIEEAFELLKAENNLKTTPDKGNDSGNITDEADTFLDNTRLLGIFTEQVARSTIPVEGIKVGEKEPGELVLPETSSL